MWCTTGSAARRGWRSIRRGILYVVDALAGSAGLYKIDVTSAKPQADFVLAAPALVGVAIDPAGGLVLASNDAVWKLDVGLKPFT